MTKPHKENFVRLTYHLFLQEEARRELPGRLQLKLEQARTARSTLNGFPRAHFCPHQEVSWQTFWVQGRIRSFRFLCILVDWLFQVRLCKASVKERPIGLEPPPTVARNRRIAKVKIRRNPQNFLYSRCGSPEAEIENINPIKINTIMNKVSHCAY